MKGIIASQENIKIAAQQAEYQHGQLKKYADVYEAAKQEYKELQGVLKLDETIAQLKVERAHRAGLESNRRIEL